MNIEDFIFVPDDTYPNCFVIKRVNGRLIPNKLSGRFTSKEECRRFLTSMCMEKSNGNADKAG